MNGSAALVLALPGVFGVASSSALEIASDSACPSEVMVREALGSLGGAAPQRRAAVAVRGTADGMLLAFRWEGDGPADARAIAASSDCAQRARAAAVVISSWLGTLPAAPVVAPPVAVVPAAGPAAVLAPPLALASSAPAKPAAPKTGAWWFGLGLGVGVGDGVVPAVRVELARAGSGGHGFGGHVAAQAGLPRSREVGDGTSRWLRPALGVAASWAWPLGSTVLAGDLGPVAAATIAWGSGYSTNKTDQALSLGAGAGVRLQLTNGPSPPWLEVRVIRWLTPQRLRFDAPDAAPVTAELPATEGFLTLGWSLPVN